MSTPPTGTSAALSAQRDGRTIDAGAAAYPDAVVVAQGISGHATGWLGARLATHALGQAWGTPTPRACVGAAADVPDRWGWAGAMRSRASGERLFEDCMRALGDLAGVGLLDAFDRIGAVLEKMPELARIQGMLVSCAAARFDGAQLTLAHAGNCAAWRLPAGAAEFEPITTPHTFGGVIQRLNVEIPPDAPHAQALMRAICSALGGLDPNVGVDLHTLNLQPGDALALVTRSDCALDARAASAARAALDSAHGDPARAADALAHVLQAHTPRLTAHRAYPPDVALAALVVPA